MRFSCLVLFPKLYKVELSKQWIKKDAILPLLDGLDEIDEDARPACILAINTYHHQHMMVPLVVCSRLTEYEYAAKHQRLILDNAVIVERLTKEQVKTYLAQAGKPFAALLRVFEMNSALQELTKTPLMLHVLMLTYQETSVEELPEKETALRLQVWDDYVQRMFERKKAQERYPLDQMRFWLSWLAWQMHKHKQKVFYLELMQHDWLPATQFYEWLAIRLPAILMGVWLSLLVNVFFPNSFDPVRLIISTFIGGYLGYLFSGAQIEQQVAGQQTKLIRRIVLFIRYIVISIGISLLIGLAVGISLWLTIGYAYTTIRDVLDNGVITGLSSAISIFFLSLLFLYFQARYKKTIEEIDSAQQQELREALLSAFPTRKKLEEMVRDQLKKELAAIEEEGSLEHIVFELIQWSMAEGRLEELVNGALKQNGQHPQLSNVANELFHLRNDQKPTADVPMGDITQNIPTPSPVTPDKSQAPSSHSGSIRAQNLSWIRRI